MLRKILETDSLVEMLSAYDAFRTELVNRPQSSMVSFEQLLANEIEGYRFTKEELDKLALKACRLKREYDATQKEKQLDGFFNVAVTEYVLESFDHKYRDYLHWKAQKGENLSAVSLAVPSVRQTFELQVERDWPAEKGEKKPKGQDKSSKQILLSKKQTMLDPKQKAKALKLLDQLEKARDLEDALNIFLKFYNSLPSAVRTNEEQLSNVIQSAIRDQPYGADGFRKFCVLAYVIQKLHQERSPRSSDENKALMHFNNHLLTEHTLVSLGMTAQGLQKEKDKQEASQAHRYYEFQFKLFQAEEEIRKLGEKSWEEFKSNYYKTQLSILNQKIQIEIAALSKKKTELLSRPQTEGNDEKIRILDSAIRAQEKIKEDNARLLESNTTITPEVMEKISTDLNAEIRTHIYVPLAKFPEETGIVARFKRWLSDFAKSTLHVGSFSTHKTLENTALQLSMFNLAEKNEVRDDTGDDQPRHTRNMKS